ncbi:MAG: restriction endonuclease subunit S [Chitinispirillia bacterium]|nr:restriction endonuclease subunit S [Chitinispirillia bacterium]MCL2242451.1 restriction endonuclease subunit S [Chitinispirillia bacterium]
MVGSNKFDGEWAEAKLEDLCRKIVSGKTVRYFATGAFPVYGSTGILGYTDDPMYEGKAILIARVGSVGTINVVDGRYGVSDNALIVSSDRADLMYIYYLILNFNFKNLTIGSGQPLIAAKQLSEVIIPCPGVVEQTAIAAALSDADALISALEALIAKKCAVWQGAMQELLTGERRLPGFKEAWTEKRLGDFNIRKGRVITQDGISPGKIPVVAGGKTAAYYHNRHNREANTITISASGTNAGFVNFWPCKIFASDCSTIRESQEYSVKFVYYWLLNNQKTIYELQTGGAQPHVLPQDLAPIEILLPEPAEQAAIAEILSDMDAEIGALTAKLNKAGQLKLGMMPELLTGNIRL